jgi:hypothetical protein
MKKAIILMLGIFFFISCADKFDPIGDWDDNIKLSTKNVSLTGETDSILITTKGNWWWIGGVTFNDSTYHYYGREDINLESDSYSITEDGFLVERRSKNSLFVKINANNTGSERVMTITLQAGNYFDAVTIKQAAK